MDNLENKQYTLRDLRDEDLWPLLDIIGKVCPDDLSTAFVQVASGEKTVSEIGMDVGFKLVVAIVKNLPKVHNEVYTFLASMSGIPAKEIQKMGFGTTPKMIWDIYNNVKNSDFFGAFSKSS